MLAVLLTCVFAFAPPDPAGVVEAPPTLDDEPAVDFDEVLLESGERLIGSVVVYLPGKYVVVILADSNESVQVDAKDVASLTFSPAGFVHPIDELMTTTGGLVRGDITDLQATKSIAILPLGQADPLQFPWAEIRAYSRSGVITMVTPQAKEEIDLTPAFMSMVHIRQTRGAEPVVLEEIDMWNPDEIRPACTEPCDDWMLAGEYRIAGEGVRPSKRFFLEAGKSYTLTTRPRMISRMRAIGAAVGLPIAIAGVAMLLVPLTNDMPMKHAYGFWGGGGALCALGLGVGVGISFSRTKVEVDWKPLAH